MISHGHLTSIVIEHHRWILPHILALSLRGSLRRGRGHLFSVAACRGVRASTRFSSLRFRPSVNRLLRDSSRIYSFVRCQVCRSRVSKALQSALICRSRTSFLLLLLLRRNLLSNIWSAFSKCLARLFLCTLISDVIPEACLTISL